MRKIIFGILILVCGLFLLVQVTSTAKAETNPENFEGLETLTEHSGWVNCVTFSQNNEWLASGSDDNTIKIWNASDWTEIKTLTEHSDRVYGVSFSPNNKWLASASRDRSIKIWDTSDWSEIQTLTGHFINVNSVAFSENNGWLASGSSDNTIKIWNTSDWTEIETLTGHSLSIWNVVFSQNNEWLASGSSDNTIKIWNTSDWSEIQTLSEHSGWVYSVSFSANNERLASSCGDNTIKIWNTSDWSEIKTLTEHSNNVKSVAFSSNNEWLASGSDDYTIKIWDTSDWSEIKTLTGHSGNVWSVAFSPNNERIASGSGDNTIKIWGETDNNDWIVTGTEIRTNETILLDGNLTIENGGNLTFRNVTLNMNCSEDGEFGINVNNGGKFYIYDYDNNPETKYDRSNITSNNKEYEFKFLVDSGSEFEMRNSELSECGYTDEENRTGLTIRTNNTIIDNSTFFNNYYGIAIYESSNNTITNNNISNNVDGIYLRHSNDNQITNNSVYSNNWVGIYLRSSSNNQITNNTVYSNNGCGIYFYSSSNNTIINNNISNTDYGIWLYSSCNNNQIINNNVFNSNRSIYLRASSINNQIINSTISNSAEYDIYFHSNSNITAINTTFDKDKVYFRWETSDLSVKWYLSLKILDKNNNPVPNAKVRIQANENSDFDKNYTTDLKGFVNWINLTEYIKNQNDGKIYYTPYNITAENGSLKKSKEIEIDQSKEIAIIIREINDWIVTGQEIRTNETILLDGNLTIENGGFLTFRNVTLIMNCFEDGEFGIVVKDGGKFFIFDYDNNPKTEFDRSNITANNKEYEFKFLVDSGSEFEMRNSELSGCGYTHIGEDDGRGGLTIKANNTIIENSSFYNNYYGIYLVSSSNNTITNDNVYSNYRVGIYLYSSSNNNQITDNTISNNYRYGFYFDSSSNNQITNNNVSNNQYGISLGSSSNNNQITNNAVYANYEGITLTASSNNQITNNNVSNNSPGIYLYSSSNNNQITNNTVSNNRDGIFLRSSDNQITNNSVYSNNNYGIYLSSNNIKMRDNIIINNKFNFGVEGSNYHDIDTSNTINGKPIIYIIDQNNLLFDNSMNIGYLGLISCSNVKIKNLSMSNNYQGILLANTIDSIIENCEFNNNFDSIYIYSSSDNQIRNNSISNNERGIYLEISNDNQIINNTISKNERSISLLYSNNNLITNNSISNNNQGIYFWDSINQITNSTISNSSEYDFYFERDSALTIINTTFNKNKVYFEYEDSELIVKWYLHVKVVDGDNLPITNGRIVVENINGEEIYDDKTGLDGWARWIACTEYILTKSGSTDYSNHTINIEDKGYLLNSKIIKMDDNKFIVIKPKSYNVFIECDEPIGYANPGELLVYEIKIINKGLENDIISLEIDNPSNWLAYLNSYFVILSSNEEKIVYLTVRPDEDETEGETSTISVKGTSNENVSNFDLFQVETTVNFVHDIEISQNLLEGNIDPGISIKYEIQLENLGNGNEEIYLKLNNSQSDEVGDWTINELVPLEIKIGISGTTFITITPPSNAAANEQKKLVFDIFSEDIFLGSITTITTVNQTHDIEIKCDENEKSGKPLETVTYLLNITNNGNGKETFLLELSGENIDWCDLSDTYISLNSNNYTEIYLDVLIPNNAKTWEKANITINVLSLDRTQKYCSINILTNVTQIYDLKIETENKEIFVEPGKDVEFDVTIENFGNGADNITLSISGIPTHWEIDPATINPLIDSESSFTNSVKLSIPENALASEIANLVFTIKSNNYGDFILDYMNLTVYVNQNYEIELECDNLEKEVIIGETVEYKIEVENKGNGKDTIILELSGLNKNWAYLSESVVVLEAEETKDFSLFVKSPSNANEGEKAGISVIAVSENKIYSNQLIITTALKGIENNPPTAVFKLTFKNKEVTKIKIGEEITFDASSSSDEEGEIVEYWWDFGNGNIRYGEKVDYTYPKDTESGEYAITLNVTDSSGTTTEKQMTIEVLEENEEENWLLYLILIVLVVIGILIVIMLNKVMKNLKDLEHARKTALLTSEKVGFISIEEEKRKEDQKRREMEMWKPIERREGMVEPLVKVEEEKFEENEEKVEEIQEGKSREGEEIKKEENSVEIKVGGEEEENPTNKKKDKDDFWDKFQREGEI